VAPELKRSGVQISQQQLQLMIDQEKKHAACKLGQLISEHTGFTEQEDNESFDNKRYVLDVVAFNSEKWWQFKKELHRLLVDALLSDKEIDRVKELVSKLENPESK
jgi:hypothetical protein